MVQNHQIDQLKEEISGKDLALVKEHFDHMKVSKASQGETIATHANTSTLKPDLRLGMNLLTMLTSATMCLPACPAQFICRLH